MKLPNRRILYSLLLVLVIAVIVALIILKGPLAPVPVRTTTLQTGNLEPAVFGVGTVEARRSYDIGFTRAGRLLSLTVDQGDQVTKGQLLGKMDPVDLPQRIRSAELLLEKTRDLIDVSKAALREAKERASQAKKEMIRYQKLAQQKQISQETADNRASDSRAADDKVAESQSNLKAVIHDYERTQADLEGLKLQLAELDLISPADGVITARNVEPGSVVTAGSAVLNLVDPKSLWVETRIDQIDSGQIRRGQAADIELRNHPGMDLKGTVTRLEIIADSLTEERLIDISFTSIPEDLSIGMLANSTIHLPGVRQAHWLPAAAIVFQNGHTGVWRVQSNKASFLPVKTGVKTLNGKVQILEGVDAQDKVVVYTKRPLEAGTKVKPETGSSGND